MKGKPKNPEVQEIIRQCNEVGISYVNYLNRLKIGWAKEEALNTARVGAVFRTKDGKPVYTYLKSIGKSYDYFRVLIRQGLSVEEALDRVINANGKVKYLRDGISLRQWCIKNGKNYWVEWNKERKKK